jgi:hypothetical protein
MKAAAIAAGRTGRARGAPTFSSRIKLSRPPDAATRLLQALKAYAISPAPGGRERRETYSAGHCATDREWNNEFRYGAAFL